MNKFISSLTIFTLAFMGTSVAFAATAGELLNLKMILSAPAIANAIENAVGARVRSVPMTPEKIKSALREA